MNWDNSGLVNGLYSTRAFKWLLQITVQMQVGNFGGGFVNLGYIFKVSRIIKICDI